MCLLAVKPVLDVRDPGRHSTERASKTGGRTYGCRYPSVERQTGRISREPNLHPRKTAETFAGCFAGRRRQRKESVRSRTRFPRDGRCRRRGSRQPRCKNRSSHHILIREKQETDSRATGRPGRDRIRHPGCRSPFLYLHQHHALCDGSLCRKQCRVYRPGPSQPERLRRRPCAQERIRIVCRCRSVTHTTWPDGWRTGMDDQ